MADNFGLKIGVEGEKEFKKALAEINQNFKVLGSEMKLVSSQFDKNDKSVDALTARNQVLNKEIDEQKNKIELLKQALDNASNSFGENDRRTQQWQIKLNNAQATLNDLEKELKDNNDTLDKTADELNDAEKEADDFGDEIDDAGKQSDSAGGKFSKVKGIVAGFGKALAGATAAIGAAAVATGKKLKDMADETAAAGDEIDKNSQRLGLSKKAYQEWDYVLSQSGVDINSVQTGFKSMTNSIDDAKNGSETAIKKFTALGISMSDLKTMSREDIFNKAVEGLQNITDDTTKAALANDLFGKSGQNIMPLLNATADSTQNLKDKAHELGMVMSDEAVQAAVDYTDNMDTLQRTFSGLKNSIMGDILPGFNDILLGLTGLMTGADGAKEQLQLGAQEIVTSISGIFPQLTEILLTLVTAIAGVAPSIIQALVTGIAENLPALVESASNIILTFVSSIILALPQITEGALQLVMTLTNGIIENLPLLLTAAIQVIATLVTGIAESLPQLIPSMVECVVTMVQGLIDNLPLLLDAALQLITGLEQGLLDALPVLIAALPDIIIGIVNFLLDSIPQIIDAGIKLLTSLVDALPQIITAIVNAIPKIINGIINAVINAIPQIIQAGIDLLIALIRALPQIITTIVKAIPQIISGIVNALIGNIDKIIMAGVELFIALIENLPTIIVEIVKAVPQIIAGIVKAFGSLMGKIVEIGGNIVKGLWDGICGLASWLWEQVSGWISGIWDGICSFFGIHSPSKEMAWVGEMLVKGLAGSIDDNGDKAVKAAENMSSDISDVMNTLSDDMKTSLPTDFSVDGNIKSSLDSVNSSIGGQGGLSLVLNITNFNNYSSEDINQLTNEIMETAGQFAKRKGMVFA